MKRGHRHLTSFALLALIIAAPACVPSEGHTEDQAASVVAQTPEAVPSPTASPAGTSLTNARESVQPTTTPTDGSELFPGLQQELYFWGGGGVVEEGCELLPGADLPAIKGAYHSDPRGKEEGVLCLFGFPLLEEGIAVELYAPDGDYVGSTVLRAVDVREAADGHLYGWIKGYPEEFHWGRAHGGRFSERDGVIVVESWVRCPAHLPPGEWRAVARSGSAYAEGSFTVDFGGDPQISIIATLDTIYPFDDPHARVGFRRAWGDPVIILGSHFEPNTELPLGIYYDAGECSMGSTDPLICTHTLVHREMVTTDNQGSFRTSILIELFDARGWYYSVVGVPAPEDGSWEGWWTESTDGSYFYGTSHADFPGVAYFRKADDGFVLIGIPDDWFVVY